MSEQVPQSAEKDARCSRCGEVVGTVVTEGGRATIRLTTTSHGETPPISCPRITPSGRWDDDPNHPEGFDCDGYPLSSGERCGGSEHRPYVTSSAVTEADHA